MTEPEPCTNWYSTRRHYSTDLTENRHYMPGRTGRSLCSTATSPVSVWDEAGINTAQLIHASGKRIVISELPECQKCARLRGSA